MVIAKNPLIVVLIHERNVVTARRRSLRKGNIFTHVCHSVHRGACMVARGVCEVAGGMHGCWGGEQCAWLWGCVHGCGGCAWLWGVCMVAGMCMVVGGVHGCRGVCGGRGSCVVAEEVCVGYDEIWSMSGQYESYWNAFLLSA